MAQYDQGSFDIDGNKTGFPFVLSGTGTAMFHYVKFDIDIKISSIAMQVGQAYGVTSKGTWRAPGGAFYGRYCIWDSNGNLIAQSNVVHQNSYYGYKADREYSWGNMTSQPVLKKNTTYRIGYFRASSGSSNDASLVCLSKTWNDGNRAHYNSSSNPVNTSRADINSGAWSISGWTWSQWFSSSNPFLGMKFKINYERANTSPRKWDGSSWADHGVKKWTGTEWVDAKSQVWDGVWKDVD